MVPHLTTALAGPLLEPCFASCGAINFQERAGVECLAQRAAATEIGQLVDAQEEAIA